MSGRFIPYSLRGVADSLDRVPSPQEAFDLFMTPARTAPARREAEVMASARPFRFMSQGNDLAAYEWGGKDSPAILLSHGWSSRASTMTAFVEPLLAAGFRVVAEDHPAHGDSGGGSCNGFQTSLALEDLARETGGFFGAVTHSFGSIGLNLYLHRGNPLGAVVHLAPFCHLERRFHEFCWAAGLDEKAEEEFMEISRQFFGPSRLHDAAGHRIAPGFKARALIIHDERDDDIPWTDGRTLAEAWPGAEFVLTKGLGHFRIIRDRRILARTAEFLKSSLSTTQTRTEP